MVNKKTLCHATYDQCAVKIDITYLWNQKTEDLVDKLMKKIQEFFEEIERGKNDK